MDTQTGLPPVSIEPEPIQSRRSGSERRKDDDRRRGASGLLALRARRDVGSADRRRSERRDGADGRSWLSFWRRST